ncbi:MAG: tRNA pseudouridine(38-40) synthase TruA [Rhodothermia bacterium]|nr:tRNA pseudouridine(38-40) synthase TruA [Rhodothermia bacterium]
MYTYRLLIEYDGSSFAGWQIQENRVTVQATIEQALGVLFKQPLRLVGSGRTDAGVHARGQVAHFVAAQSMDPFRLKRSLNGLLPDTIAVRGVEEVPNGFHARFDALERGYCYRIATEPFTLERRFRWLVRPEPDVMKMNEAARYLIGEHHFGSFCLTQSETQNRVCNLFRAVWIVEDIYGCYRFEVAANRFLHGMVRALVGTLVEVGQGKRKPEDLNTILEAQDRRRAGYAAPAHGLVLEYVRY